MPETEPKAASLSDMVSEGKSKGQLFRRSGHSFVRGDSMQGLLRGR